MRWIPVEEALPEIPEGRHARKVLIVSHDPVYEEINPGRGSETSTAMWMKSDEVDEPWFHSMLLGLGPRKQTKFAGWMVWPDEVTHWMYYPEPVQKGEQKNEKTHGVDCCNCPYSGPCGL